MDICGRKFELKENLYDFILFFKGDASYFSPAGRNFEAIYSNCPLRPKRSGKSIFSTSPNASVIILTKNN